MGISDEKIPFLKEIAQKELKKGMCFYTSGIKKANRSSLFLLT